MQHTGEGAKKGSSVVETGVRSKAALGPRGRKSGSQEQFVFLGDAEKSEGKALATLNESH